MTPRKRTLRLRLSVLALAGLVLGALSAVAVAPEKDKPKVKPYALIFGTVFGPDYRPVYGVKIKIRRADQTKAKWELYSDRRGEFAQRLPAGKAEYAVWAERKGPKDAPRVEVKVQVENDERVDISLHLKD